MAYTCACQSENTTNTWMQYANNKTCVTVSVSALNLKSNYIFFSHAQTELFKFRCSTPISNQGHLVINPASERIPLLRRPQQHNFRHVGCSNNL